MTVTELLSGEKRPLSNIEYIYWAQYFEQKAELEKEASKPKKKQGQADREFKRTMGSNRTDQ